MCVYTQLYSRKVSRAKMAKIVCTTVLLCTKMCRRNFPKIAEFTQSYAVISVLSLKSIYCVVCVCVWSCVSMSVVRVSPTRHRDRAYFHIYIELCVAYGNSNPTTSLSGSSLEFYQNAHFILSWLYMQHVCVTQLLGSMTMPLSFGEAL